MKYTIEVERGREGWEVDVKNEDGISENAIFGMPLDITRDFARDELNRVFGMLAELNFSSGCE